MDKEGLLREFSFSQYEASCYLALTTNHPSNGSQLSRLSGIARSRIYDVLRSLTAKGLVFEVDKGMYVPLPFDELKRKLRERFESGITELEEQLRELTQRTEYEYILTLTGYRAAMTKAADLIDRAKWEIYLRVFPETYDRLAKNIHRAHNRGVGIRLVAMGPIENPPGKVINHPEQEGLSERIGGESFDLITDRNEALMAIFETGKRESSPVTWTKNDWFVLTIRDSLRHDFYHFFLHKIHDQGLPLTPEEEELYRFIKKDE